MMKKQNFYFILTLLVAILLSSVSSYFFLERQNYQYETHTSFIRNQLSIAHDILDNLSHEDYEEELENYKKKPVTYRHTLPYYGMKPQLFLTAIYCKLIPGKNVPPLNPDMPIVWSRLSSSTSFFTTVWIDSFMPQNMKPI